jgi:hypothetical protein
MGQLTERSEPTRRLGGASFSLCRLEAVRPRENGWHEPYESRGSRTDLWGTGGEIPPVYPASQKQPSITNAPGRLGARGRSGYLAPAARGAVSDAPLVAVKFVRMTNVIFVAVQLACARVGLHQESVSKASLAKHSAVGRAVAVRSNMAGGCVRMNSVGVFPPCRFALSPIFGHELERSLCARHSLCRRVDIPRSI